MLHQDRIYKKRLHINHLLANRSLTLINANQKSSQNPEGQSSSMFMQKQQIENYKQTVSKSRSFQRETNLNKPVKNINHQNEHIRVIYKQVNSSCNLFSNTQQQQKSLTPEKLLKNQKSKGSLLDHLTKKKNNKISQNKHSQHNLIYDLPKYLNRYSSLKESIENLTLRKALTKQNSVTFRLEQNQLPNCLPSHLKSKKEISLFNYDNQPLLRQESSAKSLLKVTSILNLKPKTENNLKKAKKLTAMNKYDLGYENIRLASKILSMKPTRWCDMKEQKKFYKKQQYFKDIRSRTIEMNDPFPMNLISQSISFPKINERDHTAIQ